MKENEASGSCNGERHQIVTAEKRQSRYVIMPVLFCLLLEDISLLIEGQKTKNNNKNKWQSLR